MPFEMYARVYAFDCTKPGWKDTESAAKTPRFRAEGGQFAPCAAAICPVAHAKKGRALRKASATSVANRKRCAQPGPTRDQGC